MSIFDDATTTDIYENRDALKEDYVPNEIVGREEQKDKLKNALLPVVSGDSPDDVFLTGPNGVGKTALVRWILSELRSADTPIELTIIHQECQRVSTPYTLLIHLTNALRAERGVDDQLSTAGGYDQDDVIDRWIQEINNHSGTILFILDEIDTVSARKPGTDITLSDVFYQISRSGTPESPIADHVKVGEVGISNDPAILDNLEPSARSSLDEVHIEFPPYGSGDLREVLAHRADLAFLDTTFYPERERDEQLESDVIGWDAIALTAAFGAQHSGDARMALDILRDAADIAKKNADSMITTAHVKDAKSKYFREHMMTNLESMGMTQKLAMYALATLTESDAANPRTEQVYERYRELADACGMDVVGRRQVRRYLRQFEDADLTTSVIHQGTSGQYRTHELKHSVEDVLEAISDIVERVVETGKVHRTIADKVKAVGD